MSELNPKSNMPNPKNNRLAFRIERLREVWRELEPLFPLHALETGEMEGGIDVDWPTYFALEDVGCVQALIVRDADLQAVGYFIGFVRPNLHNRRCLTAVSDMYFLHPAHRGHAGLQLFREVERHWKAAGVTLGVITCKVIRDHSNLFRRLGWTKEEEVYVKRC
jgi:hypothetical protein